MKQHKTQLVRVSDELAVSPRLYKAMEHACRIIGLPDVEYFLWCLFESQVQSCREENLANVRAMRLNMSRELYDKYCIQKAREKLAKVGI